jgi:hypothetical protein
LKFERCRQLAILIIIGNYNLRICLCLVDSLFIERTVCTKCLTVLSHVDNTCNKCIFSDNKRIAKIFDVNQPLIFSRMLDRLSTDIDTYQTKVAADHFSTDHDNDIVFNALYREMKQNVRSIPSVSLLLHLDGVSLSKSSKVTLWLFSCSLIELPPRLRCRRDNMIILSVWIGPCEPLIDKWLDECLIQLNRLKQSGIYVCFAKL